MKVSVSSALLVLLTLNLGVNLSNGYPSLKTIKKELEKLMLFRPPQTTSTTPPTLSPTTALAATATPAAPTPAAMVAGFLGRLSFPGSGLHVLWPKKLVEKAPKPQNP